MPAGEVIGSYHDLWHVEQSFRMSKTDLRARPMFHHKRESIEAHLTIVFTALAVARHHRRWTHHHRTAPNPRRRPRTHRPRGPSNLCNLGRTLLSRMREFTPGADA